MESVDVISPPSVAGGTGVLMKSITISLVPAAQNLHSLSSVTFVSHDDICDHSLAADFGAVPRDHFNLIDLVIVRNPPDLDDRGFRDDGGETLGRYEGLEKGDGGGLGAEDGCTEHIGADWGGGEGRRDLRGRFEVCGRRERGERRL